MRAAWDQWRADARQHWRWWIFELVCLYGVIWLLNTLWSAKVWGLPGQVLALVVALYGWDALQTEHRWWCDPRQQAARQELAQDRRERRARWRRNAILRACLRRYTTRRSAP
jgi:hypothetical protein